MLALYLSKIDNDSDCSKFEEVYKQNYKQMFMLANSMLKSQYDAEDVIHDVFYTVATRHMDIIRDTENKNDLRNYLLKATKNKAISYYRTEKKVTEFSDFTEIENCELTDDLFLDEICAKIEMHDLIGVMENLGEKYREVLYYHFVLDLSIPEVAELLNRNIHTVKKQLVRGKNMLLAAVSIKGRE